jgi:hypothetical protein
MTTSELQEQRQERLPFERFATEYVFKHTWPNGEKQDIWITRHNNHGRWIEDGAWVVVIVYSELNPHYLGEGGHWRYKYGWRYATAEKAYAALQRSIPPQESYKSHP